MHDKQQGTFVKPHKLTLGNWLDTWLHEYKRPRIRAITFDTYTMIIRRHLKPALGHLVLRDLRPEHLQRYYNEKAQQGLEARTIRLHYVILSNALAQAEKNQLVARHVGRLVEPPRQTHREMRTLTGAQITTQFLSTLHGNRLYAAFLTLFMVGLRRGELLGLRWQDIDLNAGVLHVRQRSGAFITVTPIASAKPSSYFQSQKQKNPAGLFLSLTPVLLPSSSTKPTKRRKAPVGASISGSWACVCPS